MDNKGDNELNNCGYGCLAIGKYKTSHFSTTASVRPELVEG
jgi:hypothetical protein